MSLEGLGHRGVALGERRHGVLDLVGRLVGDGLELGGVVLEVHVGLPGMAAGRAGSGTPRRAGTRSPRRPGPGRPPRRWRRRRPRRRWLPPSSVGLGRRRCRRRRSESSSPPQAAPTSASTADQRQHRDPSHEPSRSVRRPANATAWPTNGVGTTGPAPPRRGRRSRPRRPPRPPAAGTPSAMPWPSIGEKLPLVTTPASAPVDQHGLLGPRRAPALDGEAAQPAGHAALPLGDAARRGRGTRRPCPTPPPSRGRPGAG